MKRFGLFLIIYSLGINLYCQKPIDQYLKIARNKNKVIPNVNWKTASHLRADGVEKYNLFYTSNDTEMTLEIEIKHDSVKEDNNLLSSILFYKSYIKTNFNYVLKMLDSDTFYFYRKKIGDDHNRDFIVGKYYYLFSESEKYWELKDCQIKTLLVTIDSLRKVRGNNIPEVPCIDTIPELLKKWEELN